MAGPAETRMCLGLILVFRLTLLLIFHSNFFSFKDGCSDACVCLLLTLNVSVSFLDAFLGLRLANRRLASPLSTTKLYADTVHCLPARCNDGVNALTHLLFPFPCGNKMCYKMCKF